MIGIILAGGSGTRLYPITLGISKQLIPIYNKPMIYYPLSTLLQAKIRDIIIITTEKDQSSFQNLLGDGSSLGCNFSYVIQKEPNGLAEAFLLTEKMIKNEKVCLVLGDNLFYGLDFEKKLEKSNNIDGGLIFAYHVKDPQRYGVVEFDNDNNVLSIEEKPIKPKSNYAIPGIYFFDENVVDFAKKVKPSQRGELEIIDIHKQYLDIQKLKVNILDKGLAWLDTGTFDSMNQASQFVQVIEERQGQKIGCIEEIAYKNGFINKNQLQKLAEKHLKSGYGEYLLELI